MESCPSCVRWETTSAQKWKADWGEDFTDTALGEAITPTQVELRSDENSSKQAQCIPKIRTKFLSIGSCLSIWTQSLLGKARGHKGRTEELHPRGPRTEKAHSLDEPSTTIPFSHLPYLAT